MRALDRAVDQVAWFHDLVARLHILITLVLLMYATTKFRFESSVGLEQARSACRHDNSEGSSGTLVHPQDTAGSATTRLATWGIQHIGGNGVYPIRRLMYSIRPAMYNMPMSNISIADARKHFSNVIARASGEAVFIERRGQRAAVVISPERYERMLEALENAEDATAFDEAMAEEGPDIPWAQVKADLGWV